MFERLLAKLARALDERGIDYMVIGGQAVLVYAEPRLTRDILYRRAKDLSDPLVVPGIGGGPAQQVLELVAQLVARDAPLRQADCA